MADKPEIRDTERLHPVTAELWFPRGPALNVKVRRVSGHERLAGPYEFEVEFSLEAGAIDLEQLLGTECELILDRSGLGRHIYGIVARVEFALDADADALVGDEGARVIVTPAFSLLNQDIDTRFFSGMSVIEILDEVLGASLQGYRREVDVGSHIIRDYPRRDYCVRFRESTLAFCERVMQEEGIGYFFQADLDGERERMVLFDNNEDCAQVELLVPEPIPIVRTRPDELDRESLQQLDWLARRVPNRVIARAYNLKDPAHIEQAAAQREASVEQQVVVEGQRRHIIDDPIDDPAGTNFDGAGLEQSQRTASLAFERYGVDAGEGRGRGNAIGFVPGAVFEVGEGAQDSRRDSSFLLTRVDHEAIRDESPGADGFRYENRFSCTPSTQPYRPERARPRPSVQGVLTGVIVGPEGEEVHTDALGRVRVQFHADRHAEGLEPSSCWVRVAQIWAGQGYGAMVIPRVGMEVVVSFIDGNPDCPIVTGCVYNGAQEPPYPLPAELTKTTFKSRSSPGGEGFNELRVEDAKGSEQIFVHGQRRMDVRVRGSLLETTGANREEVVGGDHSTLVRGDVNHHVEGASYVKVDGPQYNWANADVSERYETNHFVNAVELSQLTAGKVVMEASGSFGINANDVRLGGTNSVSIWSGEKLVLESYRSLELKVGDSFIMLSRGGLSIGGPLVRINSGGGVDSLDIHNNGLWVSPVRLDSYKPWDALAADDGKPGRKHGGGGGGRRTHEHEVIEPQRAPPKPLPDPPHPSPSDDDYQLVDGKGAVTSLAWIDEEAWCGETAELAIEAADNSPGARAGLWLVDAMDGSTLQGGIGFDLRDGTHKTEIYDILPRLAGGQREKDRLVHGFALTQRTPSPLRVRFLSDLPASTQTIGEQSFTLSVSNYTVKIRGTIRYVRAWMYYIINVSGCMPDVTPGRIGGRCYGTTNWWYCKKVAPEKFVFWNGAQWLPVPNSWTDPHGVNLYGTAVWREPYGVVATQHGQSPWPDPLPSEQRPAADVSAALDRWKNAIGSTWSGKHQLGRVECGSPFIPECCRLNVEFNVDFVETDVRMGRTIVVADNTARANVRAWPLSSVDNVAAHEFGHLLGNPDEYIGATSVDSSVNGDGAVNGIDTDSIMGKDQDVVRLRHYQTICDALSRAVMQKLGKQWTFKPERKL
ncbi:Phage-related baseplate assembly protein [Enhygromyxa salina]|uniref:Phage-related baseplate assembly protein n=1 Tax=Enhygromyxa salina TaxID=215803 RepID=A0A2S9XXK1_9BACT|nr:type VI secretion system tip protein TssI/VgrG [Enhygromyxa salina]PRP97582.1 Phage-related baseplate assembly protein [Enhygromyxa salina]